MQINSAYSNQTQQLSQEDKQRVFTAMNPLAAPSNQLPAFRSPQINTNAVQNLQSMVQNLQKLLSGLGLNKGAGALGAGSPVASAGAAGSMSAGMPGMPGATQGMASAMGTPSVSELKSPLLLENFSYGSLPADKTTLLDHPNEEYAKKEYIKGYVPTPKEAGQIKEAGIANVFNPEWQAQIAEAAERNGGLGSPEDGYLAWTKMGFIRYKNPNLTDEQNRKMAEITLQTGVHMEDTPGRSKESVEKDNVNNWINTFIERHDKELKEFLMDPKDGYSVKDGSKRYFKMEFNQEAGRVVSYNYRKSGGFRGFVQDKFKYIAPVLDVLSVAGHAIPGVGTAIALGSSALKTAGSWIATGKLSAKQAMSTVASFIPGTSTLANLGKGAMNFVGDWIDTGKAKVGNFFSSALGAFTKR